MNRLHALIGSAALAVAFVATSEGTALPQDGGNNREVGRTTEKELKVTLTSSFGSVNISRGKAEKMLQIESASRENEDPRIAMDYAIRNRVGYMDLSLGEGNRDNNGRRGGFRFSGFEGGKWFLKFSDAVPISFDVELGVGKGDFDLSGLQVKDFNLSTGASDVSLSFDEPNRGSIDNLSIESGVSKFDGRNLCNANFKRFHFQGGVGAYTLDFGGGLSSEVDVDVEVGLGVLTVYLPGDIGARVIYDKTWASKVDTPDDFRSTADNAYTSDNYYSAPGKMNIRIDSGLGSVKIRRR
jgi:hypothetical protein